MTWVGLLVLALSGCATVCPTGWAVRTGVAPYGYMPGLSPSVDVELSGGIGDECRALDTHEEPR